MSSDTPFQASIWKKLDIYKWKLSFDWPWIVFKLLVIEDLGSWPPGSLSIRSLLYIFDPWRSLTKMTGSGSASGSASRSISQRYGSADPDPYQNFMDLQLTLLWGITFFRGLTRDMTARSPSPGSRSCPSPARPSRMNGATDTPGQCCGSGINIPDPNFCPFRNRIFSIPYPQQSI